MRVAFLRILLVLLFGGQVLAAEIDVEIVFVPHPGTRSEDGEIRAAQAGAAARGSRPADFTRLGWAYVAKARRTLDSGFFKLAEKTVDVMDRRFGPSADSRLLRGHIWHNIHRFRETEVIARKLVAERGWPEDYALLSDALLDLGDLDGAAEALQRMVNLKPGVEAYGRISHLRWLKGDLSGATAAMEMAVGAARSSAAETRAWALARLAGLLLQAGRAQESQGIAEAAGRIAADFPPALLAQGRALLALDRGDEARVALTTAAELNPLPEYQWWAVDALRVRAQEASAAELERRLCLRGAVADPRTLALFLATRGTDQATAVRLARAELAQRGDVFTHDALAWALAAAGDLAAADAEMRAALAAGTQDARLSWHAGAIAWRRGRWAEAREHCRNAQKAGATLAPSERAGLVALAGTLLAVAP